MRQRCYKVSLFHIVPPHILQSIADKGTPSQRQRILRFLGNDHTFRTLRMSRPTTAISRTRTQLLLTSERNVQRTIYNAHGTTNLGGEKMRSEGDPPVADPAVNEAYDGLGWTHALFSQVYGRNSIDDECLPLEAVVHFGHEYDNAFWNSEYMVFGDGDGEFFNRFTLALDVIGHELTHGVTEDEARLMYFGQAGALNESISDVFGSLIKQYSLKQTANQADWLIGEGLFTQKVHGQALRSMKAPGTAYDDEILGKDPQPARMSNYVRTFEDNGGVHINSSIPNHAFYLTATKIGGFAWEKAGHIWYEALRDIRLRPITTFHAFAHLTLDKARHLYGFESPEWMAVQDAWEAVEVIRVPAFV